ncbi:hypothetical protein L7F22_048561 [Adiantum nelumboides]|nr:hypothetical protein [Adiantum nelumboides]
MASGEGQSNPSTSGDAGRDHHEDFGNDLECPSLLQYDNLTPLEKPTPYKEGGKGVTFTTFAGFDDRKKALSFLQQFDKAYAGGNFTEASKVRKAATYLTGNAGQWWTTLLLQGQAPSTWIYFKQIFASAWLSDDFEANVMTEWHQLNAASCKNLDDYNRKFWKALLPVTSYRFVPLTEQIEKYCCGLPKGLRKYCTKTKVTTLTQLIEVANTGNGLLKRQDCEFNTGIKDGSAKKNSAKKYSLNEVLRATQEPSKTWKGKATAEPSKGPANKWKKPFPPRKSGEQRQVLRPENKCFICEQPGHYATNCPQKKRPADSEDKEDRKGKRPMAGLVPDMVGDKPNSDASELCRAWGKVRDQTMLIFFDPSAKANFISPELASRLGIRSEEMGYTAKARLACLGHTEAVTPIIGKLRLHIQSYVDAEEFYIMPLDECDVLLGIPWLFRVQGILDAYNKKITVQSRGRTLILDVKFDKQKAPGLLQPLPIPDKPWESIAMDFIFDLPRTQTRNDGIWTITCRFSKQAHFIPVRKKIKPDQMARLFMSNIFKYHGMPQSIVSDRDPRMTSLFWRGLSENMDTTLKFSSSFHPQTNGQSEEANSIVLDLLKCYVSKHKGKWEQYLPLVEYAYNNTVHSSTGKAPLEIVEGGKKVPPILHTKDKIFEADKYVQDMDEMYKKVKVALEKTQGKQKKAAHSHRREVVFSLGDWVLLRFEKARPYVGDVPEDLPVEDQPEVEELDEILVPEQILAHRERKVKGKVARRYLVRFRNYPPMDAKWMEEGELAESPTVLSLYLEAFGLQPTLTP